MPAKKKTTPKSPESPVKLEYIDQIKMDLFIQKSTNIKNNDIIMNLKVALLEAQSKIIERDKMLVEHSKITNKGQLELLQSNYDRYLADIASTYDLGNVDDWSYNNDTGEMVKNEQ